MNKLIQGVLKGKTRAVARAVSLIENGGAAKETLIDSLFPHTGSAEVWGITGPPGAGKSTLVDRLIARHRAAGRRVAVIAVDPSSPFSGGALLGDRLRMQKHATDDGVFIRSMASRGYLGGVSENTFDAVKVFDAAGYDLIIIETIGVGQTEVDIIEMSDVVLLVLVPGMGDEIQAMKAGIMEIGDLFIVNKSDRDGADRLKAEIEYVLEIKYTENRDAKNPVLLVSAKFDSGIDEMVKTAEEYVQQLKETGAFEEKQIKRVEKEITKIFSRKVHEMLDIKMDFYNNVGKWADDLYKKRKKPYEFVNGKMKTFKKECEAL